VVPLPYAAALGIKKAPHRLDGRPVLHKAFLGGQGIPLPQVHKGRKSRLQGHVDCVDHEH
jgi:hypothetical protein